MVQTPLGKRIGFWPDLTMSLAVEIAAPVLASRLFSIPLEYAAIPIVASFGYSTYRSFQTHYTDHRFHETNLPCGPRYALSLRMAQIVRWWCAVAAVVVGFVWPTAPFRVEIIPWLFAGAAHISIYTLHRQSTAPTTSQQTWAGLRRLWEAYERNVDKVVRALFGVMIFATSALVILLLVIKANPPTQKPVIDSEPTEQEHEVDDGTEGPASTDAGGTDSPAQDESSERESTHQTANPEESDQEPLQYADVCSRPVGQGMENIDVTTEEAMSAYFSLGGAGVGGCPREAATCTVQSDGTRFCTQVLYENDGRRKSIFSYHPSCIVVSDDGDTLADGFGLMLDPHMKHPQTDFQSRESSLLAACARSDIASTTGDVQLFIQPSGVLVVLRNAKGEREPFYYLEDMVALGWYRSLGVYDEWVCPTGTSFTLNDGTIQQPLRTSETSVDFVLSVDANGQIAIGDQVLDRSGSIELKQVLDYAAKSTGEPSVLSCV